MPRWIAALLGSTLLLQWDPAIAADDTAALHQELAETLERIEAVAADRSCSDTEQCASLPVGNNACGGPARHITYSAELGHEAVIELLNLAERSSRVQHKINLAEFTISTCGMRVPPPLLCSEGQCVELDHSFHKRSVATARDRLAAVVFANRLSDLSYRLSLREMPADALQEVLFGSALRIADCVLEELTSDPRSTAAPYVDALASAHVDQDIHAWIETDYDRSTADGQLALVESLLDRCIESEEMYALSTYPRVGARARSPGQELLGSYQDSALVPGVLLWEGDILKIDDGGYSHSRFTDELGPWLEEPPYEEYRGRYTVEENRIVFTDTHLEPAERFFIQADGQDLLLTPNDYRRFEETGELPSWTLIKYAR